MSEVGRFVVVSEASGRIVATLPGTHAVLEQVCARLTVRRGGVFFYDDADAARLYLPQIDANDGGVYR